MYVILFLHLCASLRCFCPHTFFSINRFNRLSLTSFVLNLHSKLQIFSTSVWGLAKYSPCGVWVRGRTTCLLYGGPLLCVCFQTNTGVQFDMVDRNLLLILRLCSRLYTLAKFRPLFECVFIVQIPMVLGSVPVSVTIARVTWLRWKYVFFSDEESRFSVDTYMCYWFLPRR